MEIKEVKIEEHWRIIDEADCYMVSDKGNVKQMFNYNNGKVEFSSGDILEVKLEKNIAYVSIKLNNGKIIDRAVNELVAKAFVPNLSPRNYTKVKNIDGNPLNNIPSNLEWYSEEDRMVAKKELRTGRLIESYDSIKQASIENNVNPDDIKKVCDRVEGYVTAGGFRWDYYVKH